MNDETKNEVMPVTDPIAEIGQMELLNPEQMTNLKKRVIQQQQIKQIVLTSTNLRHWIMHGDVPYLNEAGTKIIASFFGLGIKSTIPERMAESDEKGDFTSYATLCTVTKAGREVTEMGTADTRDPFLAGSKPQSEVNHGNIKKKSITNAMNRAIKAFLGLDFTREEVEKAVGPLDGAVAVDYKSKKEKEVLTADDVAVKKEIKGKIFLICDKDVEKAKLYLEALTSWEKDGKTIKGKTDFDKVSMKQWKYKKPQVDADYKSWEVAQNG